MAQRPSRTAAAVLIAVVVVLGLLVVEQPVPRVMAQSKQCPGAGWSRFANEYCRLDPQAHIVVENFKLSASGMQAVCDGGEACWQEITDYANLFVDCPLTSRDIDPNYVTAISMEHQSWRCEALLLATDATDVVPTFAVAVVAAVASTLTSGILM